MKYPGVQMIRGVILFAAVTLVAAAPFGATIHVPSQQPTIQAGINAASNGDTVLVAPGTYTGNGNKLISFTSKSVVVKSSGGPDVTTLDLQGTGPLVDYIESVATTPALVGFCIRNTGNSGFTIRCLGSSLTVKNCLFINNSTTTCLLYFNGNSSAAGRKAASNPSPSPTVKNCTFVGNYGNYGISYIQNNNVSVTFERCLISNNPLPGPAIQLGGAATIVVNCTDIFGNAAGDWVGDLSPFGSLNGNISSDPMFTNPGSSNYHLQAGSPCLSTNNACNIEMGAYGVDLPPGPSVFLHSNLYPTIQAAIDAASPNDTVTVGSGTAYEHITITKPLTLLSQLGADSTTIDGQNLIQDTTNSIITIMEADSVEIKGFTIRGGRGLSNIDSSACKGGGVFASRTMVSIEYCTITSNSLGSSDYPQKWAVGGGGLFCDSSSAIQITNCQILSNTMHGNYVSPATIGGGGMLSLSHQTMVDGTTFAGNGCETGSTHLFGGGAAVVRGLSRFTNCVFSNNYVAMSYDSTGGGGLYASGTSIEVDACRFASNRADQTDAFHLTLGGGLLVVCDTVMVSASTFTGNFAGLAGATFGIGGGICAVSNSITIQNNRIDSNSVVSGGGGAGAFGGGVYLKGSGHFGYNLVRRNSCWAGAGGHSTAEANSLGGGAWIQGEIVTSNNTFSANVCVSSESGVYGGIARSRGGGLYASLGTSLIQNIFYSDSINAYSVHSSFELGGAGVFGDSSVIVANTDLYENYPDQVNSGLWTPGTYGIIAADPLFCFPDTGNFYLKASSPCAAGNHESGQTVGAFDVGCYGADMVKSLGLADGGSLGNVTSQMPKYGWKAYYHPSYLQTRFEIAVGTDNDWQYSEMWNPAPFNSSDTFVTYAGAPLVDGQTYYLRLRISDGVSWSNWYYTLFHMNTPPTAPVPYAPQWPEITVSNTPDLSVVNATDAENDTLYYDYQVFRDSMLTQLAVEGTHVAQTNNPDSTSWTVTPPLDDNKYYYWRARAFDGYEYSPWSSMRFFIANNANELPNPFLLLDPPDSTGSILYNRKPTFRWTYTGDPDPYNQVRYKMEMAVDAAFTFKQVIDSLYTSFWIPPDSLPYHSHYWWRVSAIDQYGATTLGTNTNEFWVWTLGDVDHSNNVDISDLTRLIDYLYISFLPVVPRKVGDLDGDCIIDIADLSRLIDHLYISLTPLTVGGCEQ